MTGGGLGGWSAVEERLRKEILAERAVATHLAACIARLIPYDDYIVVAVEVAELNRHLTETHNRIAEMCARRLSAHLNALAYPDPPQNTTP